MIDYLQKLGPIDITRMLIRKRDYVNQKIGKIVEEGFDKLHVISDYDKTITKQHVNGKNQLNAYEVLRRCPSVPKSVAAYLVEISEKYSVLDKNPELSNEERMRYMAEWWNKTIEAYQDINITQEEIDKTCLDIGPSLRDEAKDFFEILTKKEVPVLIISAGVGEVLESLLKNSGIVGSNIELVTNYLKRDNEGRIIGYQSDPIHTANKNLHDLKKTQFYKNVADRTNLLIMGDHLGDTIVGSQLDHVDNILKIGFFYGEAEAMLPNWLNTFDIILKDDQTMNVPKAILELLKHE
ncbi:7-methylguanosine phosphate-specific 5'-nucleotidase A-like [Diorhabda carinulata]|uniref:7-methylguanosine phosphate-specific 5'-nucleotidase A-like n=1 Tax=Diorhabda carinulata TaxID=1163345 RepID=UPI0025A06CDD|nr:7-methylguanosine phosphate-specific 5'-nucleotidase A-like [Diorhabda carinulata]